MAVTTTPISTAAVVPNATPFRYLEWGPVILGALGASAISIVLLTFGAALGLTAVSPYPWAGISAKGLAVLSATYAALVTVASFGAGGYLAGRLRTPWSAAPLDESHFRDGVHGFGVWALGIVLGGLVAASGVSGIVKTAVQTTTAVAAAGAAGAAANPANGATVNRLSTEPTDYAVDRLLAPAPTAAAAPAPDGNRPSRAELAAPIARVFAANLHNPQLDARDRATLVQLVVQRTGMPQADAEKRVDEAFADLKTAEQKARDAAEQARKAALIAAFAAAAVLAIACAAACGGAALGARHRDENAVIVFFGSRRFW
jgi:hypothetical protein